MAVAVPLEPGGRYYATNHEGVTYSSDKPIPLDRVKCEIPAWAKPVEK